MDRAVGQVRNLPYDLLWPPGGLLWLGTVIGEANDLAAIVPHLVYLTVRIASGVKDYPLAIG